MCRTKEGRATHCGRLARRVCSAAAAHKRSCCRSSSLNALYFQSLFAAAPNSWRLLAAELNLNQSSPAQPAALICIESPAFDNRRVRAGQLLRPPPPRPSAARTTGAARRRLGRDSAAEAAIDHARAGRAPTCDRKQAGGSERRRPDRPIGGGGCAAMTTRRPPLAGRGTALCKPNKLCVRAAESRLCREAD